MWKIDKKNYGNADAVWALALQEGTAGARLDILGSSHFQFDISNINIYYKYIPRKQTLLEEKKP